jgi:purine-binding chemotaxis protein CheW
VSAIDPAGDFGGLRIGGLQLALPMSALREVVPCGRLERLPACAEGLLGAIDLRGVLVPVLDLRPLIGLQTEALDWPCVVLVVHDGLILGLLCEGVTGVFRSEGRRLNRVTQEALMAGSLRRADDASLISVLSPAALLALPGLPHVEDPEPQRQRVHDGSVSNEPLASGLPMLLLLCGRVPLALPAMAVHATLPSPQVRASVLGGSGACLGVLEHAGEEVPVVDLPALCGLGRLERREGVAQQAFLMRLETGLVAFLIDRVLDVVRVDDDAVMPVPVFALPRRELFEGGLAIHALAEEVRALLPPSVQQFLVLSPQGLQRHAGLQALAASGRPVAALRGACATSEANGSGGSRAAAVALLAAGQRAMVTYQLGREVATPIDQIREILPFGCEIAVIEVGGAMLGLVAHRGRSIPVMCLSRLHGLPPPAVSPAVSVLVVEADDGEQLGFAVPMLRSIEPADWEPALPALGDNRDALAQAIHSRQLVQVGQGASRRMLQVVDLLRIARALQERAA